MGAGEGDVLMAHPGLRRSESCGAEGCADLFAPQGMDRTFGLRSGLRVPCSWPFGGVNERVTRHRKRLSMASIASSSIFSRELVNSCKRRKMAVSARITRSNNFSESGSARASSQSFCHSGNRRPLMAPHF
jgi:hypothetical protein